MKGSFQCKLNFFRCLLKLACAQLAIVLWFCNTFHMFIVSFWIISVFLHVGQWSIYCRDSSDIHAFIFIHACSTLFETCLIHLPHCVASELCSSQCVCFSLLCVPAQTTSFAPWVMMIMEDDNNDDDNANDCLKELNQTYFSTNRESDNMFIVWLKNAILKHIPFQTPFRIYWIENVHDMIWPANGSSDFYFLSFYCFHWD